MIILSMSTLCNGIVLVTRPDTNKYNCGLLLRESIASQTIMLYLVSMLMGYKTCGVCFDVKEFAINGNLPTERRKKCHKFVLTSIWVFTITWLFVVNALLNHFTRQKMHDKLMVMTNLQIWTGFCEFVLVTGLFVYAAIQQRQLQKFSPSTFKDRAIVKYYRQNTAHILTFTIFAALLLVGNFTYDQFDRQALIITSLSEIMILVITIQLLLSIASFSLVVRLTTQTLQGKVDIIGIDSFDREVFRFKIRDHGDTERPSNILSDMDVTSDGQTELLTPNASQFECISAFEGAMNSPNFKVIPSINDNEATGAWPQSQRNADSDKFSNDFD